MTSYFLRQVWEWLKRKKATTLFTTLFLLSSCGQIKAPIPPTPQANLVDENYTLEVFPNYYNWGKIWARIQVKDHEFYGFETDKYPAVGKYKCEVIGKLYKCPGFSFDTTDPFSLSY